MKLGSLFDGSGGFPLAGVINDIEPVWASEIEAYPLKVTAARFPHMKQLGDVKNINGAEIEPVDIITFGSPCQDLSIAGKQAGIHSGERSNLFFEAIRIIKEMRSKTNGKYPRFALWENVPGAFSSNKGEDFRDVLEAFANVRGDNISIPRPSRNKWIKRGGVAGDGWSVAWRVYDAQYWGVPQRRKRIYLVADFASERAAEILFECEGLHGHSEAGREERKSFTYDAEGSIRRSGNAWCIDCRNLVGIPEMSSTLQANSNGGQSLNYQNPVVYDARGNGDGDITPTLTGDHQNRITDMGDKTGALNCMHDQQAIVHKSDPPRKYIIRRLTPLECCRLQGFPDWWEDGVDGSDTARYKMWGNGIALPCAVDVLRRIAKAMR